MEEHDVIIIGAGLTGIYQLHRAREAGFDAIVARGGGRARRAPGTTTATPAAGSTRRATPTATPSTGTCWTSGTGSEHFSSQPENLKYLNHVADRFELRPHMRFGCRVEAATYDEDERRWTVATTDGRARSAAAS